MSVAKIRLQALQKVQCRVFDTVYNPLGLRTGNKVLRQRLKGKLLADWYPRRVLTFQHLYDVFGGGNVKKMYDEKEEERLEHITIMTARGKGAPKKKRTAGESKKLKKKK